MKDQSQETISCLRIFYKHTHILMRWGGWLLYNVQEVQSEGVQNRTFLRKEKE